ncbi:MAG: ATP-binding cassette domain-containing protein [Proteobacteria bacterium]|nr:ATP-binding cassette domain-containing protein [Pseudomonadota bacterium]
MTVDPDNPRAGDAARQAQGGAGARDTAALPAGAKAVATEVARAEAAMRDVAAGGEAEFEWNFAPPDIAPAIPAAPPAAAPPAAAPPPTQRQPPPAADPPVRFVAAPVNPIIVFDFKGQGLDETDARQPDRKEHHLKAPDLKVPDLKVPDLKELDVKHLASADPSLAQAPDAAARPASVPPARNARRAIDAAVAAAIARAELTMEMLLDEIDPQLPAVEFPRPRRAAPPVAGLGEVDTGKDDAALTDKAMADAAIADAAVTATPVVGTDLPDAGLTGAPTADDPSLARLARPPAAAPANAPAAVPVADTAPPSAIASLAHEPAAVPPPPTGRAGDDPGAARPSIDAPPDRVIAAGRRHAPVADLDAAGRVEPSMPPAGRAAEATAPIAGAVAASVRSTSFLASTARRDTPAAGLRELPFVPIDLDATTRRPAPGAQAPESALPVVLKLASIACRAAVPLADIDLELHRGEILTLIGDADSGVTTLIDILAGDVRVDSGSVLVSMNERRPSVLTPMASGSRAAALSAGIGMVRHRPALADTLTGLQNIVAGAHGLWQLRLRRRALRAQLNALQRAFEYRFPIDVPAGKLSAGERLLLELTKAIYRDYPVIALDDPLASLTMIEADQLLRTLKLIAASGRSIVLSTRRPEAALAAADRIVVLRKGRVVADIAPRRTDRGTLAAQLAGRLVAKAKAAPTAPGRSVLELSLVKADGLREHASLHHVSLDVRSGEIIGVAGTPGNGQDTLAAVVAGVIAPSSGWVKLHGRVPRVADPGLFARVGVAGIPEDCWRHALVGTMSTAENVVLDRVRADVFSRFGLLRRGAIRDHARRMLAACNIVGANVDAPARAALSDIDARKLVIARTLALRPHLILAHGATAGLEFAARADVHRRLIAERDDGAAILMISDDVDELLSLADYIGVLYRGRLSVPQPAGAFDHHNLGLMMGGQGSVAHDWSGWGSVT